MKSHKTSHLSSFGNPLAPVMKWRIPDVHVVASLLLDRGLVVALNTLGLLQQPRRLERVQLWPDTLSIRDWNCLIKIYIFNTLYMIITIIYVLSRETAMISFYLIDLFITTGFNNILSAILFLLLFFY